MALTKTQLYMQMVKVIQQWIRSDCKLEHRGQENEKVNIDGV